MMVRSMEQNGQGQHDGYLPPIVNHSHGFHSNYLLPSSSHSGWEFIHKQQQQESGTYHSMCGGTTGSNILGDAFTDLATLS